MTKTSKELKKALEETSKPITLDFTEFDRMEKEISDKIDNIEKNKKKINPKEKEENNILQERLNHLIELNTLLVKQDKELKESKKLLKNSEEKFKTFAETTIDAIITTDIYDEKILYWNKAAEKIFNYSKNEVLGKDVSIIFSPTFKKQYEEELKLFNNDFNYDSTLIGKITETIGVKKGNIEFPMEVSISYWKNNGDSFIALIIRDITERKESEKKLKENEEQYRSFIENFQGIAFKSDFNFNSIFVHGSVDKITEYNDIDFTSRRLSWISIVYHEDKEKVLENNTKLSTILNYTSTLEYRIVTKSGKIKWVHEVSKNVCDSFGNFKWIQGTLWDITKEKENEDFVKSMINTGRCQVDPNKFCWQRNMETNIVNG